MPLAGHLDHVAEYIWMSKLGRSRPDQVMLFGSPLPFSLAEVGSKISIVIRVVKNKMTSMSELHPNRGSKGTCCFRILSQWAEAVGFPKANFEKENHVGPL
jgi:hypothetical protein